MIFSHNQTASGKVLALVAMSVAVALGSLILGLGLRSAPAASACGTDQCVYNNACYSNSACRGGQRCIGGNDPYWEDDSSCPKSS